MRTKQEIVENWLPRYTERKLEDFTKQILLPNFTKYVEKFKKLLLSSLILKQNHA